MAHRRNEYARTRCVDGRTMRHDPQPDDPSLETDIGECPSCCGAGCETLAAQAELEAHNAGFDAWEKMTDQQRDDAIRRRLR